MFRVDEHIFLGQHSLEIWLDWKSPREGRGRLNGLAREGIALGRRLRFFSTYPRFFLLRRLFFSGAFNRLSWIKN